jgi:hypothetical protein
MTSSRFRGLWWISPAGAIALVVLPSLALAARASDSEFRQQWKVAKVLEPSTVRLFLAGALLFIIGAMWPLINRRPRTDAPAWPELAPAQRSLLRRAAGPLFWLTMTGYVAMAAAGFARGVRPDQLVRALLSQDVYDGDLKQAFAPVVGITTLTQVGIPFVVVGMVLLQGERDRRLRRRVITTFALGAIRAFFLSERLAILELAVPAVTVLALARLSRPRKNNDLVRFAAPFVALPLVLLVFGALEYSRSWVYYSQHSNKSVVSFVIDRAEGYYATSYNNGQLLMTYGTYPGRVPYYSLEAFWTAPVISNLDLYQRVSGHDAPNEFATVLEQHASPEFNTPGGLAVPFVEFGTVGGLAFLFLAGSALGLLYRSCCDGHLLGTLVYPAVTTGLFEFPRYLYWTQGRMAPAFVVLAALAYEARRSASVPAPEPVPVGAS